MIVDLDGQHAPYGDWLRADTPHYDPDAVEDFFARQGFRCHRVDTTWRFSSQADLAAVLRIEFSRRVADRAIRQTSGLELADTSPW